MRIFVTQSWAKTAILTTITKIQTYSNLQQLIRTYWEALVGAFFIDTI
ncbi:MAG: hypothetical protein AAFP77_30905 [Bacteroidota bacterium]